jgi:hypothetical protein
MGTNYYARMNRCDCCGRGEDRHIGKSYRTLRAYPEDGITTWNDWLEWLTSVNPPIVNEYGDLIELSTFIEGWKPVPGRLEKVVAREREWRSRFGSVLGDYIDDDGFHLCPGPFS